MRQPTDSTNNPLHVGDRVRWRGYEYTIREIWPPEDPNGIYTFGFEEHPHLEDIPDEVSVDKIFPYHADPKLPPQSKQQKRYIVEEISGDDLAGKLEEIAAMNVSRGYRLHSFTSHNILTGQGTIISTLIAVFELEYVPVAPTGTVDYKPTRLEDFKL